MKTLNTIFIAFLSAMIASARVIKYEHNLEFIKYEVDEANGNEEDHLTVKIYTIGAMESKFNNLSDELAKQQQQLFEKNKINSEKLLKKFDENAQKINENLSEINNWVKKNLNDYERLKNEMEIKKQNITENYMKDILTTQNHLNVKKSVCKESTAQMNKELNFLKKILAECSKCSSDRIGSLNREIQAANKNLMTETQYCEESTQLLIDSMNKLRSSMTDEFVKLLTAKNQEFVKIIEKFYNVSKLEKLLNDSVQSKAQYFTEKERMESSLETKLQNLNQMLKFESIKPKSGEIIYNTNEIEGENFLQDFLTKTNGKDHQSQTPVIQSLLIEEPSYIKWEKIHEKTSLLPENSVIAGYDIDGSTLYVVRVCKDNECYYGKYARSDYRKNAYIPLENDEKGFEEIELLVAQNYEWCSYDESRTHNNLPVCRVEYNNSKIPGTLQKDGKCRIGYGWKIFNLEDNVEVLGLNGC